MIKAALLCLSLTLVLIIDATDKAENKLKIGIKKRVFNYIVKRYFIIFYFLD